MQTKTSPELVIKVNAALGNGRVVNHDPTITNELGQSGVHTFVDDVIDIVLNSRNESAAFTRLCSFLIEGSKEI